MYSIQSLNDLRMIMDYFPSYVRLNVRRWAVGGISMGGHATAMALAEGNRVST
jgi:dienelactone hydrolase